jgi:hypothetical protein
VTEEIITHLTQALRYQAWFFIGTTTVPGLDGRQDTVEVHVFPEVMRGTGEGSRPYDLHPTRP